MRQFLVDLVSLLSEQKTTLEVLLDLADTERKIIIEGQSQLLEDIVRKEVKELYKINSLEKKRQAMHKDIALALGISEADVTISAIAERSAPAEREVIVALQRDLVELLNRHTNVNAENRELIKAHLEYTDMMLETVMGPEDPLNNFYGGDGKSVRENKKNLGFFDGQA